MEKKEKIIDRPIYLILLALYPSISLLALNIKEVDLSVTVRPLFASLLFALIIFLLHSIFVRTKGDAYIQTAVFLVLFFSYGHVYTYIANYEFAHRFGLYVHIPLLIVFVLVYVLGRYLRKFLFSQTSAINLVSLILLIIPFFQIGQYTLSTQSGDPNETTDPQLHSDSNPDIYYIILDAYNRADNLLLLGYDNSPFLDELREIGFFVADCSQSNYQRTALSLSSSLNMDYIFNAIPNDGPKDDNAKPVYNSIKNNRVRRELKNLGYKIFAFQSGYRWGEWRDADIFFKPDANYLFARYLTPFEMLFLESTAIKIPIDLKWLPFINDPYIRYGEHYERVHYVLDTLPEVAALPGPKFTYAHLIIPHTPYVFLPDGSINPDVDSLEWTDEEGYINNVKFINSALVPVIRKVIQESENPPVIVIQADHGTAFLKERRYFILNTYYLPGKEDVEIPSTITPVNTFRLIFNLYFGADFSYKDNVSFANDIGRPYKEVTIEFPEELSQCLSP
ncbi:MAG: hypothetical protein PVF83_06590 [Anaerolineales bacterium]|jgi:hypothetical protein